MVFWPRFLKINLVANRDPDSSRMQRGAPDRLIPTRAPGSYDTSVFAVSELSPPSHHTSDNLMFGESEWGKGYYSPGLEKGYRWGAKKRSAVPLLAACPPGVVGAPPPCYHITSQFTSM